MRTVDGVAHTLAGSFVSARGESNIQKFENDRVEGKDIDDETDGISMSCHAQ